MPLTRPHIHDLLVHYFSNKELDELYLSFFLKSFALSMINLFIPIYLLTLGYSIADIALYFLINFSSAFIFMFPGMWCNSHFGIKKTMSLGIAFLVVFYYFVNQISGGLSYVPLAVLFGVSTGFYYAAFHVEFAKSACEKKEGEEVSILSAFAVLAGVLGPLIGSFFIASQSFEFVFFVVAGILFLAILPLFFTPDKRMKKEVISIKSVLTAQPKKRMFIYQAEGVLNLVGGVFWPVFIYLAVKNVVTLGAIVSMTSLLLVVFIVYIGGLVDKNVKKTLKRGVFLNAPFWIIRLLFLSPVGLFINNFLGAVTSSMVNISLSKLIYGHAEKTKRIGSFFLFRELHLGLGRVLILVLALFIPGLLWMFVVAFLVQFVHLSAVNW
jgi:MFS family permease|tara:strand:+ start:32910 stop:34055 length:1146 start_codon:yes stop_codon:yes gene_type:complete